MKKTIAALLLMTSAAFADVTVTNVTVTVPVLTTNTVVITNAKRIWTSFSIAYYPPAYSNAIYSISYFTKDMDTGKEIPGSRQTKRMTEKEVAAFAASQGIDFSQPAQGISYLINKWLEAQTK